MANLSQLSVLSINGNSDDVGLVTNFAIGVNQGDGTVRATLTVSTNYDDKSPLFNFFVENQPAELEILIENSINSGGPTTRTIKLQNAVCRDYVESFSMTSQTMDNMNDLLVSITVQADSVTMGETSFPA